MSIFDRKFKLQNISYMDRTVAIISASINNKLPMEEVFRLYNLISVNAMSLTSDYDKLNAGMKILNDEKASWLTNDEKKSFVSGVWLGETKCKSLSDASLYSINKNELEYTKKAVLGVIFNKLNKNKESL